MFLSLTQLRTIHARLCHAQDLIDYSKKNPQRDCIVTIDLINMRGTIIMYVKLAKTFVRRVSHDRVKEKQFKVFLFNSTNISIHTLR